MKKILIFSLLLSLIPFTTAEATLSCSVQPVCSLGEIPILKLSSTSGGHAETILGLTYSNNICCSGVTSLGILCSGNYDVVAKLSDLTNAHVEQNTQSNYATDVCLSAPSGTVNIVYQADNCTGYDTTIASMSGVTNAHIGDSTAYSTKICGKIVAAPTLSFSISDNTIGFGNLNPSSARYATGDLTGSTSETEAHTLTVSTNATNGYTVTVQGATLTSGANTVNAIGNTNTASSAGTEQFGLRASVTSGTGSVSAPYAASGFAYSASSSTAKTVATGSGDSSSTIYSMSYLANIAANTEAGSYATALTYIAVANF